MGKLERAGLGGENGSHVYWTRLVDRMLLSDQEIKTLWISSAPVNFK